MKNNDKSIICENTALSAAVDARQDGKLKKAEKHIKLALKRAPNDPNTLHQAALIARDRGRNSRALQLIEKAAERSPHSAPNSLRYGAYL